MSEWISHQLGNLISIKHGFAFKGEYFGDNPEGPILVTPGNFAIGGGFKEAKPKSYSGPIPDGFTLTEGDLVITMTDLSKSADTLGYPALIPPGYTYLHNQRIGRVEILANHLIDKSFLYYALCTEEYRNHVINGATGTTVKHTSPGRISEYRLNLPRLTEQRAISVVLAALDDKIAVNERILATADDLMRVRYRRMSEFASELIHLGELGKLIRDTVSTSSLMGAENYIGLEHMPRRNMWLSAWDDSAELASAKSAFATNDVLFGKLRPYFHKVGIALTSGVCSTDILVVRPKRLEYLGWLLLALSSDEVIAHASAVGDGTRMPRAKWKDLESFEVPWPGADDATRMDCVVRSLAQRIQAAVEESRTLASLRNTLLPQLMSGRLRVRDAEKIVEDAI